MPLPLDLFTPVPGELPGGDNYCFQGWQRLNVDIVTRIRMLMRDDVGSTFWNISATTPSADKRIYPWLNLVDGRVYAWSFTYGKWISPRPFSFGQILPSELGYTEAQIWALDGGDGTDPRPTLPDGSVNPAYVAPTLVTGAMWRVAHSMDGRFPLGACPVPPGIPGSQVVSPPSGPATVAQGATVDSLGVSGEYQHTLTQSEGGIVGHTHKIGAKNPSAAAAVFRTGAQVTVPVYPGWYIGGDSPQPENPTTEDLETDQPLDATGKALVLTPFNKMPPYQGCWFVVPTQRQFYAING